MVKKYSEGMSYQDMVPYGGKYAKKKKEMREKAAANVKRLTTQPDAYDPETRYITGFKRERSKATRVIGKKTTDQVNLKAEADKIRGDLGRGSRVAITESPVRVTSRGFEPIRYDKRLRAKKSVRKQMPYKPESRPLERTKLKRKFLKGGLLLAPIKAAYKKLRSSGTRNTSEIVKESKVSRDIAKSDVKSAIRREVGAKLEPNLIKSKKRLIIQALNALK